MNLERLVPKGAQYKATRDGCLCGSRAVAVGSKDGAKRFEDDAAIIAHLVKRDFDLEALARPHKAAVTQRFYFAQHHARHAPFGQHRASRLRERFDHEDAR